MIITKISKWACLVILAVSVVPVGCGKKKKDESSSSGSTNEADDQGRTTGEIDSESSEEQKVVVGEDSTLKGSSIAIPPGSLSVSTEISVEEGQSLANDYVAGQLGLEGEGAISSVGPATVFSAAEDQDANSPMTLSILTNDESAALAGDLMVLYKVRKSGEDKLYFGLIPSEDLTIGNERINFDSSHFGVFQAVRAIASGSVEEVETSIPIAKKSDLPIVEFATAESTVSEDGSPVAIALNLSQAIDDFVVVGYSLGGTADENDHGLVTGSFIFEAGETEQNLEFNLEDDGESESSETLVLTLTSAKNAKIGTVVSHTLTISDND